MALQIPYITNTGRKGGSNVAAAVVNALAIMADEKTAHEIS
jgi:precorrin-8X/cobalt-precorrin-8 methylmutase